MKISIIGAGYSSLVLAYILKQKNHEISIFDSKNYAGGVLNDYFEKGEFFLKGCQYLEPNKNWFKGIISELQNELKSIEHIYGSFTSFKNEKIVSRNFSVPKLIYKKNLIFENLNKDIVSVEDKLNAYPKDIKYKIECFLNKYNLNLKNIYHRSSEPLGFNRVALDYNQKKINILKKNKIIDDLLAIKNIHIGTKKMIAYIPRFSYTNLFQLFCSILKKKNVKIHLNKSVFPKWNKQKLIIFDQNKKEIKSDFVIWTGNPTNLLKEYNNKKLDSFSTTIYQMNALLENDINFKDKYINIFSDKSNITRIFLYKTNRNKICVESSVNDFNEKKINFLHALISKFGIKNKILSKSINVKKDKRYNIISCKDKKSLEDFNRKTINSNLINCNWHIYGRNNRINSFLRNLKIKNLL
jgi:hypothetical protein